MKSNVAIIIVNGGKDPEAGRWLSPCLDRILVHTIWPNYHLYVWNNNLADPWVAKNISRIPNATLVEADPDEVLTHKHAVPLQRLYELALKDNPKYVVALDSDAHPIRDGWLSTLINPVISFVSVL